MFQERAEEDLLIDYYVDLFEKKPIEAHRNENGEIQFTDTGDDMIDKWEAQIAAGETPDLNEAFSEESFAHIEKIRQRRRDQDPYGGMSMKDMYEKVERQGRTEGVSVGRTQMSQEEMRKQVAERLARKTFEYAEE